MIEASLAAVARGDYQSAARLLTALQDRVGDLESCGPPCGEVENDLAATAQALRDRARRAAIIASGVATEATVERETFAVGDTVRVTVAVYNPAASPAMSAWRSSPTTRPSRSSMR